MVTNVARMSQAISKAKARAGLVESIWFSKGRQGVTTALRLFTDALRRDGKFFSMELNSTGARSGPLVHAVRMGNTSLLPKGTYIQADHVVMLDAGKMGEVEPTIEEVLFNFPTGLIVVNTKRTPAELAPLYTYKFDGEIVAVDIVEISESMTPQRPAPPATALMGVYAGLTQLVSLKSLLAAVEDYFTHHGLHALSKKTLVPANLKGIRQAYEMGKSAKRVHFKGTGKRIRYYHYKDLAHLEATGTEGKRPRVLLPTYESGENPYIYRNRVPVWIDDKCERCDVCWSWLFCPDHNIDIIKPGSKGQPYDVRLSYSYCQECHICAAECTAEAIVMRPQEDVLGAF